MAAHPFIFEHYDFDAKTGVLLMRYRYEGGISFEERITFPSPIPDLPPDREEVLDRAFRLIFLLAGVSYYKAYVPQDLICEAFPLGQETADFITRVYRGGLGEFSYRNKIDLSEKIKFAASDDHAPKPLTLSLPEKLLVPVGGGKDSIVSIELLKQTGRPITLFALGKSADDIAAPIQETIETTGLPALKTGREISKNLLELNKTGVLNGHVPITAILSCIAVANALLHGFDTVVMSNEHSASSPNLKIDGIEINHQYSKSLAFEADLAEYVATHLTPQLRIFSLLRPLTEAAIAKLFAKQKKYHSVFRSCNTAFRQDEAQRGKNWCCDCPKCRFVFLALAPFLDKQEMVEIFGKNMLDDKTQMQGFSELCGLSSYKPFECVGEIEESAILMEKLAKTGIWKDDVVVKKLGNKLAMTKDFEVRFNDLFALRSEHRVPEEYLRLLNAQG